MAVYGHTYKPYDGPLTPERTRFLVLPRHAYAEVFRSRLFVAFFVLCFVPPFVGLLLIYLHHNVSALAKFGLPLERLNEVLPIDAGFFSRGLWLQGELCYLLVLLVGPALISPDLRNNGLPLYLSRPFSRAEYVLGKLCVLVVLLSALTWVPGLLLFLFQGYLEGAGWIGANLRIAGALFLGSWVWILFLSLFALAVSAWVKWKPVARIALLVLFFAGMAFGRAVDAALDVWWGGLIDVWRSIAIVWAELFGVDTRASGEMPVAAAWAVMLGGCLLFLFLLSRRLRAYEVVR